MESFLLWKRWADVEMKQGLFPLGGYPIVEEKDSKWLIMM